ncbi:hypothetical protein AO268_22565 [Pseudomonas sp. ICMP 8385]|uniref:phage tail assembly chaperone family protein, TAC n=1 Tax=Pseudomonas sp. ICMP 8385 TaxID=1718920 RepID=UPI000C06D556|nr:phage tail assembly chaperone family protein, TAC [Pseudomonas sp. ICMP 8385]PHN66497.1 hypothetical protein AO268_22565 [Pseudomonas sp. ICMP 8385]
MDLSIKALAAAGAFAGMAVKKDIEWFSGGKTQKATIYVRQESFIELTQRWESKDAGGDVLAERIANNILKKDGSPVFSVGDVLGTNDSGNGPLCAQLTLALLAALNEANGIGEGAEEKK